MATLDEIRLQQLLSPFQNQNIGITNTTAATPFINTADILNQYNVPGLRNQNLVDAIIAQNMQKNVGNFINAPQDDYASLYNTQPDFINAPQDDYESLYNNQLPYSGIGNMRYETPRTIADQNRVLGQTFTKEEPSGIAKLLKFLMPGTFLENILPQESPEIRSIKNFYRRNYGLTSTGQVASGIMAGYNPVYGGLLNMVTGGRYGRPTQYGLADAARRRIQNIATRKAPQTEASRRKIAELQRFAERDTISRARQAAPDVYRDAGREGRLGPGGGFSTSGREGAFSSKSGRGRQDF